MPSTVKMSGETQAPMTCCGVSPPKVALVPVNAASDDSWRLRSR